MAPGFSDGSLIKEIQGLHTHQIGGRNEGRLAKFRSLRHL